MAQILKLRRSSVSGQKPTNDNLQLGELAVNTTDGKVFLAKSGSLGPTIEEIVTTNTINTGSINLIGGITVSGDVSGSNIKALSFIKSGGKNTEYLMADGGVSTLTNPITGSGNPNYIPKFSASGTIGNSQIFDDGISVGIGLTSSTSRLEINPLENQTALKISNYSVTGSNNQPVLDIRGTWNTSGTPTLIKANVTNTASNASSLLMDLQVGGASRFGFFSNGVLRMGGALSTLSIRPQQNQSLNNSNDVGWQFVSSVFPTQTGFDYIFVNGQGSRTITAGAGGMFWIQPQSFSPTSGAATFTTLQITQTINQTGGANGITRGLHINPTLTSAADWRSIEWSNNTGYGLYGSGSAKNYLEGNLGIGTVGPTQALDVSGNIKLSNSSQLMWRNAANNGDIPVMQLTNTNQLNIGTTSSSIPSVVVLHTNSTERLRITSTGDVGIGTSIPNSKLDVNGNTTLSGSLMVSQSLIQYSSVASVPSGSVIDVASFNTGSYTATFFDFVITSGSNSRAGTIFTTWNGNNIEYTETSTNDIGNTTSLQLSTSLSAGSVKLRATSIMGSWSVKTLARMI